MASSRSGSFLGLLTVALGGWLIDSAVQNRPPIKTLEDIVKNPKGLTSTLSAAKGTAYPVTASSATSGVSPNGTPYTIAPGAADPGVGAVVWARTQIGKPYQFGATGPNAYDCSGLVQKAYAAVGISLPRTTYQQILVGSPVAKADLHVGDLVFPDIGHVQLYSGNGNVVEAPHTGTNVREVPMWGFMAARRVSNFSGGNNVSPSSFVGV